MKKILIATLLGLSTYAVVTTASAECYRNGLCDSPEKQAAEDKAKADARLSCIRSGKEPKECPSW